jgi:hypothetical protein
MWNTGAYSLLAGNLREREKPFGKLRHRWDNNIKMDLKLFGRARTGLTWLKIGASDRFL